jgi:porin
MTKNVQDVLLGTTALIAILVASPAFAGDAAAPAGATSSPQAAPPQSDPSPYQVKLTYTGEIWDNATGGIKDGSDYVQNIDAQLAVDTEKAFGWTGGRFFIEGFYASSRSPDTQLVGPIQDPSPIDDGGVQLFRLYQAYYDQTFDKTDLLFGLYDIQTEFAHTQPMNLFFNGAYAWNTALDQSGYGGNPSTYPNTAPAFRARQTIDDQWSVQGVIADGASDNPNDPKSNAIEISPTYGAFMVGEVDYTPVARTKIMAGAWDYTGRFTTLNEFNANGSPRQVYGQAGGYIGAATRLYTQDGKRGLDGFANIGVADRTTLQVDRTLNAGLTYTGLLDIRPQDKIGVAFSIAGVGNPYKASQIAQGNGVENYETNFEATYRAKINDWLTLQPDVQYWIHPNVNPAEKNDLILGFHFEIGHLFSL